MEEKEMTLGQRITAYRTKAHLSQDSLAELLEVSRQSVSKWETDASTPELGKLVRLSQVFGVSLDELVKGEAAAKEAAPELQVVYTSPSQDTAVMAETLRSHRQKIAGIVLLTVSGVGCFLQLGLIMLLWPLLLIGLLCLMTKRVTGLGIGWLLWLSAAVMCYGFTSVNLFMVFHPSAYGGVTVQLLLALLLWLALAALVAMSAVCFRTGKAALPGWPVIAVMAAAWLAVTVYYRYVLGVHFYRNALSYLMAMVLAFLTAGRLWEGRKK